MATKIELIKKSVLYEKYFLKQTELSQHGLKNVNCLSDFTYVNRFRNRRKYKYGPSK